MRALNSQRLRPRTSIFRSASTRSYSYLLFLLLTFHLLLHGANSRSVLPQDDTRKDGTVPESSSLENIDKVRRNETRPTDLGSIDRLDEKLVEDEDVKTETNVDKDDGDVLIRDENDETTVVKKRRRNDVSLPVKNVVRETNGSSIVSKEDDVSKIEGIRRFDAEVESMDEIEPASDQSAKVNVEGSGSPVKGERSQKKAIKVDDVRSNESIAREVTEKVEPANRGGEQVAKVELDNTPAVKEDVRNDLRSLVSNEDNVAEIDRKKTQMNESKREERYLEESRGKFKHKSSTVYLSADDGSETPDGEKKSIVDSQIKKLISIRDDALGLVSENLDDKKKPDEVKDLDPIKLLEIDDVIVSEEEKDDVRSQRSDEPVRRGALQKMRDQAETIQRDIRNNSTLLKYLRENEIDVLPELKFTENQLFDELDTTLSHSIFENKDIAFYAKQFNETHFTKIQVGIMRTAEQLVTTKLRQRFIDEMYKCITELSMMNCLRIYVFPVAYDTTQIQFNQSVTNLIPVSIDLNDLYPFNRNENNKTTSKVHQKRSLTPESVVLSMLKQALESRVDIDKSPYFIDSKNDTFQKLLTRGQLEILQMGEKLLPSDLRREYSDRMFSCVRRFEYLSCLRYFAWPMMRQYFPALPIFPDYQSWYPTITIIPEYPIVPFPSFSGEGGELPEVVDSDATRMRKPTPEAVITQVLHNTLKEHPKVETPPPLYQELMNFYTTLIPQDQLTTIQIAEQFLPFDYRPEFVQKAIGCIQQYNYLTCMKYFTWPTVKQFGPNLPDFSSFIPNIQIPSFSDLFSSIPNVSPTFSGLFGLIPGWPANVPEPTIPPGILPPIPPGVPTIPPVPIPPGIPTIPPVPIPPGIPTIPPVPIPPGIPTIPSIPIPPGIPTIPPVPIPPAVPTIPPVPIPTEISNSSLYKNTENGTLDPESKIINALEQVRTDLKVLEGLAKQTISANMIILKKLSSKQLEILILAEGILPPLERGRLLARFLTCLDIEENFINCTQDVIWPTLALHALNLPDFPKIDTQALPIDSAKNLTEHKNILSAPKRREEEAIELEKSEKRTPAQNDPTLKPFEQSAGPMISVTGTRFVPIFAEHPESVMINILQRIQESLPNTTNMTYTKTSRPDIFFDLFNTEQQLIVNISERLLPYSHRAKFLELMVDCVTLENFMVCSRDVLWYTLTKFYPDIPAFPYLNVPPTPLGGAKSTPSVTPHNPTESGSSHLSEINVKTGQHGDATVTITDTRFLPIVTEVPETIILNILEAVRISQTNLPRIDFTKNGELLLPFFTERQLQIIAIALSLLPEVERDPFIDRLVTCVQKNTFMDCTRDCTWPIIHRYFPTLPSFPDFGILQNTPITNLPSSIILNTTHSTIDGKRPLNVNEPTAIEQFQTKLERILEKMLVKDSKLTLDHPYIDINNPLIKSVLTKQQMNITKLIVSGLPDLARPKYVSRLLECMQTNNFITCSQRVSWPTLKAFFPSLPSFPQFSDYAPQLPVIDQIPDIPSIPSFPDLPGIPDFQFPQLPPGIPALPGGIQIPGQVSQFSGVIGQIPDVSQLGNIPIAVRTVEQPKKQPIVEQKPPAQILDSKNPVELEQQLTGSSLVPSSSTPSVGDQGIIPGYPGQPSGTLIDISTERVHLPDNKQEESSSKVRRRRNVVDLFNSYPETAKTEKQSEAAFPNMDESQFLQLLIHVSRTANASTDENSGTEKQYFVDTLNSTIKNSLTADQYEILKKVEDLSVLTSNRSFFTRVLQCIRSLSFIRCMGIFVWPLIASNLPSLPSFPSFNPFGRSTENEVEHFFGMSTLEFEKELLARKESIENFLLDSYRKLSEEKFETNWGFLKLKGYGNGEIGISFARYREGRGTKIKDNKNLPSILTIISDIMEEVLDQRPDSDKNKKDKDKRDRSLGNFQDTDNQFFKYNDDKENQDDDITKNRSVNDEEIITMFLDKIKSNVSDNVEGGVKNYLNLEDAYGAFEVLFGTRLNRKFMNRLKSFQLDNLRSVKDKSNDEVDKSVNIVSLESQTSNNPDDLKVIPLDARLNYDLEKESDDQTVRNRQDRTRNTLKSFVNKFSDSYLRETRIERSDGNRLNESDIENNSIKDDNVLQKDSRSKLMIQLPHLTEDIISRKVTSSVIELGRSMKLKMMQMMPGVGFVVSFLIQMGLAHARAAASMAGMLSNMALGSAMFGMIRQALLGPSTNPKIKYVYDNDKVGSGIVWPPKGYYAPYYG